MALQVRSMKVMVVMRHQPQIGQAMQGRKRKREMVCDHSYIFNTGFTYPNFELAQLKFLCFLQGDGSNECKKRGRGTVKGLAAATKRVKDRTQKLPIEFSSRLEGPVGPNYRTFVDEVVLFTRKRAPLLGVNSWKDIKENVKNVIAEEILVRCILFFVPNHVMHKINHDEPFIVL